MAAPSLQVPAGLTTQGLVGKRYMARIVDSLLLAFVIAIPVWILRIQTSMRAGSALAAELLLYLILWIGYGTWMECSPWQATLGKRCMGLRVYGARAERLTPLQSAGRNIVKDGPFLVLQFVPSGLLISWVLVLAHIVVLHRSRVYQAIHDRIAGTWVAAPDSGATDLAAENLDL